MKISKFLQIVFLSYFILFFAGITGVLGQVGSCEKSKGLDCREQKEGCTENEIGHAFFIDVNEDGLPETDIVYCCPKKQEGDICEENNDCESGLCNVGVCKPQEETSLLLVNRILN